jgi:hypothetical protein
MSTLQRTVLLDAIHLMASPASVQIQPSQASADEVALDWENAWRVAEGLCQDHVISMGAYEAITQIKQELEAIGPADTFWSDEALRNDSRWQNFRTRAQALLTQLTADPRV